MHQTFIAERLFAQLCCQPQFSHLTHSNHEVNAIGILLFQIKEQPQDPGRHVRYVSTGQRTARARTDGGAFTESRLAPHPVRFLHSKIHNHF
eukprot:3834315-Rhodomonas_salina.1